MSDLIPEVPFPNSYWVLPGQLLAGEYPSQLYDVAATRRRLERLLAVGVTFFLDLTQPGERELYVSVVESISAGRQVQHVRAPIVDFGTPSEAEMIRILDVLDQALAAGHVVYLHCWGGRGRTGTVVGCYLARHGLEGEAALAEIVRLRAGIAPHSRLSPETDSQRQMVRNWPIGR